MTDKLSSYPISGLKSVCWIGLDAEVQIHLGSPYLPLLNRTDSNLLIRHAMFCGRYSALSAVRLCLYHAFHVAPLMRLCIKRCWFLPLIDVSCSRSNQFYILEQIFELCQYRCLPNNAQPFAVLTSKHPFKPSPSPHPAQVKSLSRSTGPASVAPTNPSSVMNGPTLASP